MPRSVSSGCCSPVCGCSSSICALRCCVGSKMGCCLGSNLRPTVSVSVCAVTDRTLVLIKPDGVQRGLIGEIISRIQRKMLSLAALERKTGTDNLAQQHYAEHNRKPSFSSLLEDITSC